MTEKQPQPKGLHAKLAEVYEVVTHIEKNGTAPAAMGGFKFAQASDVAAAIRKALGSRAITMLPELMVRHDPSTIQTRNGATLLLETVEITWRITDGESGESATIQSLGSGSDTGDKAIPKAITSSMKYALLAGFMIPQGDDPEREDQVLAGGGIASTGRQSAQRAARPAPRPAAVAAVPAEPDYMAEAAAVFGDMAVDDGLQPAYNGPGSPAGAGAAPSGGAPRCETCGAVYKGAPGDYWHRADDGTIHRPAGQKRNRPS